MDDEIDWEDMKIRINTLIWMNMPGTMTLESAEALACEMFNQMKSACEIETRKKGGGDEREEKIGAGT